ncbi:MAG TPA: hypothetical protein VM841_13850 [Actinomycetota bacterium]|nr:hypothetical protein [Actinomycetota bacterium]
MTRSRILRLVAAALVVALAALPARSLPPGYVADYLVEPRPLCCGNGIALHGDTLLVNHAALDAISAIDVNERTIASVASEDDGDLEELVTPDDLWRDPVTGDIYVTEILTNGVRKIAPDGTRTRVMTGFGDGVAHPNAITGLRRPGEPLRLFISMVLFEPSARTGIWEIDPHGLLPPRLVYGAAGGQTIYGHGMRAPNAMAFGPDGEELFVPESYGGAVWAIDVDAHTARTVFDGASPAANGIALRFAADGSILYAEQNTGRLLRLSPQGPSSQIPQVVAQLDPGIDGIAEHADGRIFLSNFRFGGIAIVHPGGAVEQMFRRGMDLPNGIVEVREPGGDYDPQPVKTWAVGDLGSLALVDASTGAIDRVKQFIRDDFDIAIGAGTTFGCDVYATGFFRGTLQKVNVCDPAAPHTEVVPRRTFVGAWDVMGPTLASLFVSDVVTGIVWDVRYQSQPVVFTPFAAGLAGPTGLAWNGGDLVFVAETEADRIRVYRRFDGGLHGILTDFDEPEGLAFFAGRLLVVEAGAGRLTAVSADGTREVLLEGLATKIRGVGAVPVLNYFSDVAVAADGTIVVTSPLDGSIIRLRRP